MTGTTINRGQLEQLASKLGIADPGTMSTEDIMERMGQIRERADRARARSFEDSLVDPTGGLLMLDDPAPMTATRTATKTTTARTGDADVDAAVADGRIEPSERETWLRRFEEDEPPRARF